MAVAAPVRLVEALAERREIGVAVQSGDRNADFVGLPAVAHAGAAQRRQLLARKLFLHQIRQRRFFHAGKDLLQLGGLCRVEPRDAGEAAGLVHVGDQHAEGAEGAGIARNENAADAELGR